MDIEDLIFPILIGLFVFFAGLFVVAAVSDDEPPTFYQETRDIAKACYNLYPDDRNAFDACVTEALANVER